MIIFLLHFGQKLLGLNIEISLGNLKITTLRKLPIHMPIKKLFITFIQKGIDCKQMGYRMVELFFFKVYNLKH